MLAKPVVAALLPCVTIKSAGEDFVIEPFGVELEAAS